MLRLAQNYKCKARSKMEVEPTTSTTQSVPPSDASDECRTRSTPHESCVSSFEAGMCGAADADSHVARGGATSGGSPRSAALAELQVAHIFSFVRVVAAVPRPGA